MPGFGAQQEAGRGKGLRQQADGVAHRGRRGLPFQLVHDNRRLGARIAFDVDLGEDCLDRLVIRGASAGRQPLGVGRVDGKGRLGHGRSQHLGGAGAGDVGQRIQLDLQLLVGRRARIELLDQRLDALVVLGRGPSDDLAGLGAHRERRAGERGSESEQRVRDCGSGWLASQLVDGHGGAAGGIAFDVDLVQDLLDSRLVDRVGIGCQTAGIGGIGRQLGPRDGGRQQRDGRGGRDVLQRIDRRHRRFFRRRARVETVDQRFDFLLILGRGPSHKLSDVGPSQKAGQREGLCQQANRIGHRRAGCLTFQLVNNR